MNAIYATWTKGQIVPDEPADWPEGSKLVVRRAGEAELIAAVGPAPTEWLPGFWQRLAQGWQGERLVRSEQGEIETRDRLQ
jgi:hypothetical protein